MNKIHTDAYETGAVDRQRYAKAVRPLDQLAEREDTYAVQPLAMAAWLDWITGRAGYVMTHAIKSLDLDESCSLAALILAAAGRNTTAGATIDFQNDIQRTPQPTGLV